MNISQDKTALINDLKQRYQYCFHSTYPEDIVFLRRKLVCGPMIL